MVDVFSPQFALKVAIAGIALQMVMWGYDKTNVSGDVLGIPMSSINWIVGAFYMLAGIYLFYIALKKIK